MKKKFPKYQIAGQNPCGQGTVWDPKTKQCIPDVSWANANIQNNAQQVLPSPYPAPPAIQQQYDTGTSPTSAMTDANGRVIQSGVIPINANGQFDPMAGRKDSRGTFIPNRQVIGDALNKDFNLDSDGVYRKKEITRDPNKLAYNDAFKALNLALDTTRFIANTVNDAKTNKQERKKLLDAQTPKARFNPYENGLNNVPVYFQSGGMVNNTGYTPGTPTYNNPYNIIPGGNITMEHTPFDVMAYPDNGKPTLMKAGGKYNFKGAKYVTEVPCMQQGGVPEVESVTPGQANAELENGEIFQQDNGNIQKVDENEPRHEEGGSLQPNVQRVLEDTSDKRKDKTSKLLKIKPEEALKLVGFKPKEAMSHSALYEEALKRNAVKLKGVQNKLEASLEYVKHKNGGQYAENALIENAKLLMGHNIEQQLFDTIYNHQEQVKMKYGVPNQPQFQTGGPNLWNGDENDPRIEQQNKGLKKGFNKGDLSWLSPLGYDSSFAGFKKFATDNGYDESKIDASPIIAEANNEHGKLQKWLVDENLKRGNNTLLTGLLTDYEKTNSAVDLGASSNITPNNVYDLFVDGKIGVRTAMMGQALANKKQDPAAPVDILQAGDRKYATPKPIEASKVHSNLGLSGGLGNLLGYIDTGRIPVDLEQMERQPLRVHERNPLPTLLENQADFNAATQLLPTNGIGYANQANLAAGKYAANNKVLGEYENVNKAAKDNIDAVNNQNQFQLDTVNLGLRDQFTNRILLGKEKQRQQKFEFLNGIFKAIDNRDAFDRNANMALQLTPFFNADGTFNGNKYEIAKKVDDPNGNTVSYIVDKQTGERFRTITDKSGKLISKSKIITDNTGVGHK